MRRTRADLSHRAAQSAAAATIRWMEATDRDSVADLWRTLEQRWGGPHLSSSWQWTETWLRHYGDLVPHRFAVGEIAGDTCGVVLVTNGVGRRRGPFTVRTRHLGTAGEPVHESVYVEYNRVLVHPEHRASFADALMEELRQDRDWHELHFDGFAPEDAAPFLVAEPLLEARRVPSPSTSFAQTERASDDVLATLRSSTRRKVRRSLEALGDVEVEWAETPHEADDVLSELIELHQRRWTAAGEPGAFASPRLVAFHRELVSRLLPSSRVILFRVRAGGRTVGCLYHFVEGRRVLFYQSGFTAHDDRRVTPGFVTFGLCMRACHERGLTEYDFLAGDSRYKRELSNVTRELVWARARRPALRWAVMDLASALRSRTRRRWSRTSA